MKLNHKHDPLSDVITMIQLGMHGIEKMKASDDVSPMIKKIMPKLGSSEEEGITHIFSISVPSLIIIKGVIDIVYGLLLALLI